MAENNKLSARIPLGLKALVSFVALIIMLPLVATSLLITVIFPTYTETVEFAVNPAFFTVLCLVILMAITYFLDKPIAKHCVSITRFAIVIAAIMFLLGLGWAVLANTFPYWDSLDLIDAARSLGRDNQADKWANAGYMMRFPHQLGYTMLIKVLLWLTHDGPVYFLLELINAIASGFTTYFLIKYAQLLFSDKAARYTGYLCLFFLPLTFYTTFAYGNEPCLPFALAALYYQTKCYRCFKPKYLVVAALSLTISILLKSTMVVVLIAMELFWVLYCFKELRRGLICIVVTFACYFACSKGLSAAVSARYGVELNQGVPSLAFVAMGVSASDDAQLANMNPGWYNGFIWNLSIEDYSTEALSDLSKENIQHSLSIFASHPDYAFQFFSTKIAAMWLEPTYTGLTNGNWPVMAEREMSPLLKEIYYGQTNNVIVTVSDAIQLLTLISAIVVLLHSFKSRELEYIAPAICFIGFFLIYLVWEAKSQYSMPAYVLLFVYSGAGVEYLFSGFGVLRNKLMRPEA